jgi:hypothetical protein
MAGNRGQPPASRPDQPAHSLVQFAVALVRNAVPVWGFFHERWTPSTTLVVYWAETVIGTLLIAWRMAIHRRLTHKRGYEIETPAKVTVGDPSHPVHVRYVGTFLTGALLFTIVHGIFLAVLVFSVLPENGGGSVDARAVREGVLAIAGFLALAFLLDLVGLKERPFAWIRSMADAAFSRIVVVHMTIILGMFGVLALHRAQAVFTVFVALKFLADVTAHTPRREPREPPAWMRRAFDRVSGEKGGFAAYWTKKEAKEEARAAEDELVDRG